MVQVLEPEEGMRIYDPVSGVGGFLIEIVNYFESLGLNSQNISLYGQEINIKSFYSAKTDIFLHDIIHAIIDRSNSMKNPILENNKLRKIDLCIGNPIWNQRANQ